jgi:hypothetical protein
MSSPGPEGRNGAARDTVPSRDTRVARRRRAKRRRLLITLLVAGFVVAAGVGVAVAADLSSRHQTTITTSAVGSSGILPTSSSSSTPRPPTTTPVTATFPSTTTNTAATTSTTAPPQATAGPALAFDATQAMQHVTRLAGDIGVRAAGSGQEAASARYARDYLQGLGYVVSTVPVALPGGLTSHNIVATRAGARTATVIVGAHLDSKAPSPGGNDNASGVGVVLELARDLAGSLPAATVRFVLFGAEEMIDADPNHDHYGSRDFVRRLTAEQRADLAGMISTDMVASGDRFVVGALDRGPGNMRDLLLTLAKSAGLPAEPDEDTSTYGQGDYEAFALAGFPAAWVEWADDSSYHTAADTPEHVEPALMQRTGDLLRAFLTGTDAAAIEGLLAASQ